jgi:hypothetical protein
VTASIQHVPRSVQAQCYVVLGQRNVTRPTDDKSMHCNSLFKSGYMDIREVNEGITSNTECITSDFRNDTDTIALLLLIEGCLVVMDLISNLITASAPPPPLYPT